MRRRVLAPPLAMAVGVGIVVVVFLLGAYGPSHQPGTTFLPAWSSANKAADSITGGPWELVAAVGFAPATASEASGNATLASGCTVTPAGGTIATSVYVPAFSGSFSAGAATWWGMFYLEPSTRHVLLVEVTGGTATPLFIASGACLSSYQNLSAVPPNIVDSSVGAATLWNEGGSAFVSAHSGLSLDLEMVIVGGGNFLGYSLPGATWLMDYTPCPPLGETGPAGSQPQLEALVNATSGSLLVPFPLATETACSTLAL